MNVTPGIPKLLYQVCQRDMAIPENKILLAVYLATSEVENDRRSWNVRQGFHKAKQEGRWVAHLPKGYEYRSSSTGQKQIALKEPDATYLKHAFTLIAKGTQPIQSVFEFNPYWTGRKPVIKEFHAPITFFHCVALFIALVVVRSLREVAQKVSVPNIITTIVSVHHVDLLSTF